MRLGLGAVFWGAVLGSVFWEDALGEEPATALGPERMAAAARVNRASNAGRRGAFEALGKA